MFFVRKRPFSKTSVKICNPFPCFTVAATYNVLIFVYIMFLTNLCFPSSISLAALVPKVVGTYLMLFRTLLLSLMKVYFENFWAGPKIISDDFPLELFATWQSFSELADYNTSHNRWFRGLAALSWHSKKLLRDTKIFSRRMIAMLYSYTQIFLL